MYLKACKRCEQLPRISHLSLYGDPNRSSYSVTCCTTLTGKYQQEVIDKWNSFNIESKSTFCYNRENNSWEKAK